MIPAIVLVVATMPGTSEAQGVDEQPKQDTRLISHCAGMKLVVQLQEDEGGIGNVREFWQSIQNAAESRLRSARLLDDEHPTQSLVVHVAVIGEAVSISISLQRFLSDTGYGLSGWVGVWEMGFVGTHSYNTQFILGALSTNIDDFLTGYLRANEESCGGPAAAPQ